MIEIEKCLCSSEIEHPGDFENHSTFVIFGGVMALKHGNIFLGHPVSSEAQFSPAHSAPNGDYSERRAQVSGLNWSQSVPPPQLRMPGAYHSSGRLSEYFSSIAVTI